MTQTPLDSILERLKSLPLPPSLIVSGGHGYHVYWCFKEAKAINVVDGAETIERVEAALLPCCWPIWSVAHQ